ncbi:hypothetical protein PCASD_09028 [Puccinia coronata f. sp. avenae]|uniref:Integrase catalytic domain-containing protein n=1 Tax=Puccinia coronata f. sp. avenae TaxID=200324 RepID=A0A2N5UIN3_9BASI|nr:hypothetical protein PCASD_09028 [Puccinia coronata f. sp. avenae]
MITLGILESLLDLFFNTVTTLQLDFAGLFRLPSQTINAIGQIRGLQNLRINALSSAKPMDQPSCFERLIMETQALNRLGHASFARIKAAVPNEKLETTGHCDPCMKGKLTQLPFRGHFDPTQVPLQVIHGDIVGPITPSTNSGKCYFLTLVDQHTGYISVTLLKQKSEAMNTFLAFKIFFEKQTGHFIIKLITDGGGEFVNKNLNNALESFGIQHNILPPYTPQHNGVAERANKTIINMARCMLSQSNLAKEWWGEAFQTAMAVTNCLPSPKHLRATKFDLVSWDGIVIGYSNDYSAYKVICLPDNVNHFPHSGLPDFESVALFPFQEEDDLNTFQDEDCVPDEQEEERMVLDDDEGREQEKPLEDQAEDPVGTQEDSPPAPPP